MNEQIYCSSLMLLEEETCKSEDIATSNGAENPASSITPAESYNSIPCHRNWIEPKRPSIS